MPTPRPEFRINPKRSIEIFGEFTDELAARVLPRITELREPPTEQEPITVYINSAGGDVRVLEIIDGALNCQTQDGITVPVITVVVGNASSAAADLLVYGDYAIAYPHSEVFFHGVRFGEIKQITAERAGSTTEYLRQSNLEIAYRLARSMMPRIVHRYAILRGKFTRRKRNAPDRSMVELESFIDAVIPKLKRRTAQKLTDAVQHIREARQLTGSVMPIAQLKGRQSALKQDEKVLCALIRHETKQKSGDGWRLDQDGISTVMNDYLVLRDYHFGEHRVALRRIILSFGVEFLTPAEYRSFSKIPTTDTKRQEQFLITKASPKLELFWYFAVILCRNLLRGENLIDADEAYWIGAVDEVVGKLAGRRLQEEHDSSLVQDESPPPSSSPASGV